MGRVRRTESQRRNLMQYMNIIGGFAISSFRELPLDSLGIRLSRVRIGSGNPQALR